MNPTGMIFEVKRFAVHDGPGVRTALFLKGCSLRCRWCHNPESVSPRPQLAYYAHKCLHCGECVAACPQQAHGLTEGKHLFDRAKCVACGACEAVCLGGALKLFGRTVTVEEASLLALEDRDFYKDGGGCTVSGGEPLLQAEFCAALFQSLRREGVHCAVDTSGAVEWKAFETVLPFADMFLYDVKHVDDTKHREQVGASNRQILDNLKRLSTRGVPIEVRIPAIPGFNLDAASMDAAGKLLGGLKNIVGVKLLPYHLARSKYEAVGRVDTMPPMEPPPAELEAAAARLRDHGLNVK